MSRQERPASFRSATFVASPTTQKLITSGFNQAVFQAPARALLETAPETFTDRGYALEQIELVLDTHAYYGVEISHGSFIAAMDLADAHWAIMEATNVEAVINLNDRPCDKIPKPEQAETDQGRQMLETYWQIHEAVKTIPRAGSTQLDPDKNEILLMLAVRNELNALRDTYTPYDFRNTEGIQDDMNDFWIHPMNRDARKYREGLGEHIHSKETFRYGDAGAPTGPVVV